MGITKLKTAKQYRILFRANMALGLLISVAAVYFIITGQYANLETRKTMETLLNIAFFGGILYIVLFWYACAFTRPVLEKHFSRRS